MRQAILRMSSTTKNWVFGTIFVVCLLLAVLPPVYLWAGRRGPTIFGLGFSVAYMIFDGLLITATVWALWYVENIRGEVEPHI